MQNLSSFYNINKEFGGQPKIASRPWRDVIYIDDKQK